MNTPNRFSAVIPVSNDHVYYQMCAALEGGSNYWIERVTLIGPPAASLPNPEGVVWWGRKALYDGMFDILVVEEEEYKPGSGREHHLTPEAVQRGLAVMATEYVRHFGYMMDGSGDATTGDVFLQCCLFGELIYG